MQNCTILDVDLIADPDGIDVAAKHCAEPDAAFVAHDYIANNYCCFSKIASISKERGQSSY
jgi:hypothetical protein